MIIDDMRKEARQRLFSYRKDSEMVANWESLADPQSKRGDNMGIRGSTISDPTASTALNRASPPPYIEAAREWVAAINDAWAELLQEDADYGRGDKGKAYVMEQCYGLSKPQNTKYDDRVQDICDECAISKSTLSNWKADAVMAVIIHASSRQLFA